MLAAGAIGRACHVQGSPAPVSAVRTPAGRTSDSQQRVRDETSSRCNLSVPMQIAGSLLCTSIRVLTKAKVQLVASSLARRLILSTSPWASLVSFRSVVTSDTFDSGYSDLHFGGWMRPIESIKGVLVKINYPLCCIRIPTVRARPHKHKDKQTDQAQKRQDPRCFAMNGSLPNRYWAVLKEVTYFPRVPAS